MECFFDGFRANDGFRSKRWISSTWEGIKVSELATSDADIDRRIGLATGVARGLTSIWRSNDICTRTKVRLYKTLVLAVLLYNSETWSLKEAQIRRLQVFEMTVLHRIRGVTRWDRHRNVDIRKEWWILATWWMRYGTDDSRTLVKWCACCRPVCPTSYFTAECKEGTKPRRRPRKRWLDGLREDFKIAGITEREAEYMARDPRLWSRTVYRLLELVIVANALSQAN